MKPCSKLLILFVILLIALLTLVSCNKDDELPQTSDLPVSSDTQEETEEEIPPLDPENIQIFVSDSGKQKSVNFTVIRPRTENNNVTNATSEAALNVLKGISDILGSAPKLKNDVKKEGDEHSDDYEILIGLTTYPESKEAAADCPYGDYIIDVIDNKIVILSYTDEGILCAAEDFLEELEDGYNASTGVITLKESEIAAQETLNEQLSEIPLFEGGSFRSYYNAGTRTADADTQCDEVIISSATTEMYDAYLDKLETSGFDKYTDHEMAECKFATFVSEEYMLNVGFYDNYDEVRVIIEDSDAPRPALEEENTYTKVTDSQITMLGLEYYKTSEEKYASNGLSLLIRLEDGRFVVVDGGFNRKAAATMLVDTIKEQAADYTDEPVIAAWIITHSHGDHNGMINSHYERFEGITVESFMMNFMAESERQKSIETYPDNWSTNEGTGYTSTYKAAEALGSTVYKIHVGQVFYVADLKMEVLYTLESFAPAVCNALNTSSTVIKMTFTNNGRETTYLCTGDATGHGMQICANMYDDYMQCDIVQTCHHGYSTWGNNQGMIEGYTKVNATLVLWPQGLNAFKNYIGKDYNNILFNLPHYKECYVAGTQGDLTIIKLPYVYGESEIIVDCTGECPHGHYYSKITIPS